MRELCLRLLLGSALMCFACSEVQAKGSAFKLGVNYTSSVETTALTYEAPDVVDRPNGCGAAEDNGDAMSCRVKMRSDQSVRDNISYFITPTFKRTGTLYFSYGPMLGFRIFEGIYEQDESTIGQPITDAYLAFYAVSILGVVRFGITPRYWPDLIASLGLGVQALSGYVEINGQAEEGTWFFNPELLGEIELVYLRWKDAAISSFVSLSSATGSEIYEGHVDQIVKVKGEFGLYTAGLVRLVLPFP